MSRDTPSGPVTFRALHAAGCFLLPNPWDVGSAVLLHHLGYRALATSSAGFAFTLGRPDRVGAVPVEAVLEHVREIAAATPLPVNADFQNGYADEPDAVAVQVARCVQTGAAGLSIEDATGDASAPLYERELAIERVRAARAAIDASGIPVVLTARCEAFLVGSPDAQATVLDRLVAFAEAGADCLFAPGVRAPEPVAAIVEAVAPRPVNVLMSTPEEGVTVKSLADLGVRRISLGSAFARIAWAAFLRSARSLRETGEFDVLAAAAPFGDLDPVFAAREA